MQKILNEIKKPVVINFTGAPGAGKSTGAAYMFSALKRLGYNCELVTEFAKDVTWEHNMAALNCQEYVFGIQSYRLARCRDAVDIIITDSPLPLELLYNSNPALGKPFEEVVLNVFNTYNNFNVFVERAKPYNPVGRNQTEAEADKLSIDIINLYKRLGIPLINIAGSDEGYSYILETFLAFYENLNKVTP